MDKIIIGIGAKKQAGKDTSADILVKELGFKKMSFAAPLKDICSLIFDMPIKSFYENKEDILTPKVVLTADHIEKLLIQLFPYDTFIVKDKRKLLLDNCLGKEFSTPREILQYVGTDMARKYINDSIWVNILVQDMNNYNKIVIPDMRFSNERDLISSLDGKVVLIKRNGVDETDGHISENDLGTEDDYDIVIENNGTLEELKERVLCL